MPRPPTTLAGGGGVRPVGTWLPMAPLPPVLLACLAALSPSPAGVVVLMDTDALPRDLVEPISVALHREVDRSAECRWQEPPPVSLNELMLAMNCGGLDDGCQRRMAANIQAEALILVTVTLGEYREIELTYVSLRPAKAARASGVPLGAPDATARAVAEAARVLLGPLKPARLRVVTVPAGAQVEVDGHLEGVTPLARDDFAEGDHAMVVHLEAYRSERGQVHLTAGELTEVRLVLQPEAKPAVAPVTAETTTGVAASDPVAIPTPVHRPSPGRQGPWPAVAVWSLVGVGAGAGLAGLFCLLAGQGLLATSAALYALVWRVQAAQPLANPAVYPLGVAGVGALVLASLLGGAGLTTLVAALSVRTMTT